MTDDSLLLGPDAQITHSLNLLRSLDRTAPVISGQPLVPGIWFDLDPEARAEGNYATTPGQVLQARFDVTTPGRWLGLHFDLGTARLDTQQIVGFVCRSQAGETMTLRACLRTGAADGFTDRFFSKRIVSFDRPSLHMDVMQLTGEEGSGLEETWRQLILFFDPGSFDLSILDMRVFVV